MPFAQPVQTWKEVEPGTLPPIEAMLHDPVQAKKDRALRGRKRIAWKEDRRDKHKPTTPDEETEE
jgi:hypothetical protein